MMVLCPNHHREATSGAITEQEQRGQKASPFNIKRGYVNGKLKVAQSTLVVSVGSNQFIRDGFVFRVDTEPLLSLHINSSSMLEISLYLYDEDDNLLATIDHNEWRSEGSLPWDLSSGFRWLTLRQKKRMIALSIDARRIPLMISGSLWHKQQHFEMGPSGLLFNGVARNVGFAELCFVAMYLQANTETKQFLIVPDEGFGKGTLVSEANRKERIRKGLRAWDKLVAQTVKQPDPAGLGK